MASWRDTSPPPGRKEVSSTRRYVSKRFIEAPDSKRHARVPEGSPRSLSSYSLDSGSMYYTDDALDSPSRAVSPMLRGRLKDRTQKLDYQLRSVRSEAREANRRANSVEEEVMKLKRLTQTQNKEIGILEEQKMQLLEEINLFQQHVAALNIKLQQVELEWSGSNQQQQHLQNELHRVEHDRIKQMEQRTTLEAMLVGERTRVQQLEDQITTISQERDRLARRLPDSDALRLDRDAVKKRSHQLERELEMLKQENALAMQDQTRTALDREALMTQLATSEGKAMYASQESALLHEKIQELTEQLHLAEDAIQDTKNSLNLGMKELVEELEECKHTLTLRERECAHMEQELDAITKENAKMRNELILTHQDSEDLHVNTQECADDNKRLRHDNSTLKGKLRTQEAELGQLHDQIQRQAWEANEFQAKTHQQGLSLQEQLLSTQHELDLCKAQLKQLHQIHPYVQPGQTSLGESPRKRLQRSNSSGSMGSPVAPHNVTISQSTHEQRYVTPAGQHSIGSPYAPSVSTPPPVTMSLHRHHPSSRYDEQHSLQEPILSVSSISHNDTGSPTGSGTRFGSPVRPMTPPGHYQKNQFGVASHTITTTTTSCTTGAGHERPTLGIELKMLDSDTGKDNKAVVHTVLPNSAASRAGIKANDIIERWNGMVVTSKQAFGENIANSMIGGIVHLAITRDGRSLTVPVTISGTTQEKRPVRKVRSSTKVPTSPPRTHSPSSHPTTPTYLSASLA